MGHRRTSCAELLAVDRRWMTSKALGDDPNGDLGVTPAGDLMAFLKRDMVVTRSHVKISVDLSP